MEQHQAPYTQYAAMSTVIWVVMNVLGEMTAYLPVKGASATYFVNRFTEPSLGFATGEKALRSRRGF